MSLTDADLAAIQRVHDNNGLNQNELTTAEWRVYGPLVSTGYLFDSDGTLFVDDPGLEAIRLQPDRTAKQRRWPLVLIGLLAVGGVLATLAHAPAVGMALAGAAVLIILVRWWFRR